MKKIREAIEEIKWDDYSTAYGPATKVGQHLLGIHAADTLTVDNSFSFLASNIFHQGDVHSAVLPAFPLMLQMLDNSQLLCRNRLMYLLGLILKTLSEEEKMPFDVTSLYTPSLEFLESSLRGDRWAAVNNRCLVPFAESYLIRFLKSPPELIQSCLAVQRQRYSDESSELVRCSIICCMESLSPVSTSTLDELNLSSNELKVRVLLRLQNDFPSQQDVDAAGELLTQPESDFAFYDSQILMNYSQETFFPWIREKFQIAVLKACLDETLIARPLVEEALVHLMSISSRRRSTYAKLILEYLLPQRQVSDSESSTVVRRVLAALLANDKIWEKDGQLAGTLQRLIGIEDSAVGRERLASLLAR